MFMFDIPVKVKVGGLEYDVEVLDRIRDSQSPVGRCSPMDGSIEVFLGDNDDFMCQTFMHELVHALHYQMGYSGDQIFEDEHYVDGLANALYSLIKDNPGLFKEVEREEIADEIEF